MCKTFLLFNNCEILDKTLITLATQSCFHVLIRTKIIILQTNIFHIPLAIFLTSTLQSRRQNLRAHLYFAVLVYRKYEIWNIGIFGKNKVKKVGQSLIYCTSWRCFCFIQGRGLLHGDLTVWSSVQLLGQFVQ